MGLGAYKTLFSKDWVNGLKGAPESGMAASVRLYRLDGAPVYDPTTNTYTTPQTDLYVGKARVQPMMYAVDRIQPNDSTINQKVLISLPIGPVLNVAFALGDMLIVTAAELNPSLTKYQYILTDLMDSSNPLERTLMFTSNSEVRVGG